MIKPLGGSGSYEQAIDHEKRLQLMAVNLAGDLWHGDYPVAVRAECIERIKRWSEERDVWLARIAAYEEARA